MARGSSRPWVWVSLRTLDSSPSKPPVSGTRSDCVRGFSSTPGRSSPVDFGPPFAPEKGNEKDS